MKRYKLLVLFFLLLDISVSLAQNAGFDATIGMKTTIAKNGDTLHVCKGGTVIYKNTSTSSRIRWRYSNGTTGNSTARSLSVDYPDTGLFFTVQTVSFTGTKDDSIKVNVVVSEKDPLLKADFAIMPPGSLS